MTYLDRAIKDGYAITSRRSSMSHLIITRKTIMIPRKKFGLNSGQS